MGKYRKKCLWVEVSKIERFIKELKREAERERTVFIQKTKENQEVAIRQIYSDLAPEQMREAYLGREK